MFSLSTRCNSWWACSKNNLFSLPHAILVFLDQLLLVFFVLHPVLARYNEVGRNPTLWARPGEEAESAVKSLHSFCRAHNSFRCKTQSFIESFIDPNFIFKLKTTTGKVPHWFDVNYVTVFNVKHVET